MANDQEFELVTIAIEKLMEENKNDEASENGDDRLLLSRLLSQVEILKGEELVKQREGLSVAGSAESEEIAFAADEESEAAMEGASREIDIGKDEIVKELKKLRKQNFVTHCLLSVMIVLTVAWQLSEVSLILKVKNSLSNPFQTLGGLLRGMLKRPEIQGLEEDKSSSSSSSSKQNQSEAPAIALPPLKLPELPIVQLPDLIFEAEKH